jgi:hypothetical protein
MSGNYWQLILSKYQGPIGSEWPEYKGAASSRHCQNIEYLLAEYQGTTDSRYYQNIEYLLAASIQNVRELLEADGQNIQYLLIFNIQNIGELLEVNIIKLSSTFGSGYLEYQGTVKISRTYW